MFPPVILTNTFELDAVGVIDKLIPVLVIDVDDEENVAFVVVLTTCNTEPVGNAALGID